MRNMGSAVRRQGLVRAAQVRLLVGAAGAEAMLRVPLPSESRRMRLPIHRRLPRPVVAVLAVALSIGMLAGPTTAAAPVYLNSDGNCDNPPTSSRTIDQSSELPLVVIDYGRSKLVEANAKRFSLVNLDTGGVEFFGDGLGALGEFCLSGPYQVYLLVDDTSGPVNGPQLQLARYKLTLQDNTVGVIKNLRFSVVP